MHAKYIEIRTRASSLAAIVFLPDIRVSWLDRFSVAHTIVYIGHEFENSRVAFRRAKTLGAEGVELDIHATRDGAIVVHHGPNIEGLGRIGDLALDVVPAQQPPDGRRCPSSARCSACSAAWTSGSR